MGHRYSLRTEATVIGRGDDCEIQARDHSVSRRHARIVRTSDGFTIRDLHSTNGTFVNDEAIESTVLKDGDYLRIGNCIYRFLAGGNVEAEYHEEIYRLIIMDGLTQIANRRYLLDFLEREVARSNRHQRPLALVMFDIDWFKSINDDFGHLGGDAALRELADRVRRSSVRREDLFARFGGEEFALVLVETGREEALQVAERIRKTIEAPPFRFDDRTFSMTVSVGVACTDGGNDMTAGQLVRQADDNLYRAKRAGRNRVVG